MGLLTGGALAGGSGTAALFSDREQTATTFTAGELDIKLDWRAYHSTDNQTIEEADLISEQIEPVDADGTVAANFTDVKPGDVGCFSLSLHNQTNPAWVWLAMDLSNETNGDTPPSDDGDCPPAQYPWVCGQDDTDGNVTVTSDDANLYVEITAASGETLEETSVHVTDSESGIPQNNGGMIPGQFEYKHSTVDSSTDSYTISFSDEGIESGDEVVIAVHAAQSDGETCWAGSTSGTWNNWGLYLVHTVCTDAETETVERSLADCIYVTLFWDDNHNCVPDNSEQIIYRDISLRDLANNVAKDTGGLMPNWSLDISNSPKWVSAYWYMPASVGNEIQGDSVDLNWCVYAEQTRHNDDPESPWT